MVIKWSEQAKIELKEILLYWKNHNKSNSYSIKLNAEVHNYSIFYLIEKDSITILSFWDNRRNPNDVELL